MRVLVVGSTGVAGRRCVRELVAAKHDVTAAVRSPERARVLEGVGARTAVVNLFDFNSVLQAVRGHDAIVNVATRVPPGMRALLRSAWRENDRIRREGVRNLVDAALESGAQRLVQESIPLTYPDRGDAWIDETVPISPVAYNQTVADAERQAKRFTEMGRTGVVLRFAWFYGPDSSHTLDSIRMLRKGFAPVFGQPEAYMSSIATDDVATSVVAALDAPAGVYNVCDDRPIQRSEYIQRLAEMFGVKTPRLAPHWLVGLLGSGAALLSRSQRVSNHKLKAATNWSPAYPDVLTGWRALIKP